MTSTGHVAGREQDTPRAHAVPRAAADGPPPWVAVCGARVAVVRGAWSGRRGLGSADPCPECRAAASS
jgi:hypothetical protein